MFENSKNTGIPCECEDFIRDVRVLYHTECEKIYCQGCGVWKYECADSDTIFTEHASGIWCNENCEIDVYKWCGCGVCQEVYANM